MTVLSVAEIIKNKNLKKFTGPPEHWLTTFNTGFWGLEKKYENQWLKLRKGDLFLLHSCASQYMTKRIVAPIGIVGVGIVSGISKKESLEWIGEIKQGLSKWPLLVHFSEICWFGQVDGIDDKPIKGKMAKGEDFIAGEIKKLLQNHLEFKDIKKSGYSFPVMGSIANIKHENNELIVGLLTEKLVDATYQYYELDRTTIPREISVGNDPIKDLLKGLTHLHEIDLDDSHRNGSEVGYDGVKYYTKDPIALEKANKAHLTTLLVAAKDIKAKGLTPKESNIDILVEKGGNVLILEVKSIHQGNLRHQTRFAIGQLYDYGYFDIALNDVYSGKELTKGIVFSTKPPDSIIEFLRHYMLCVFWVEKDKLTADPESMKVYLEFCSS